jgi:drug/metabolite transporter (DMT)-like permease
MRAALLRRGSVQALSNTAGKGASSKQGTSALRRTWVHSITDVLAKFQHVSVWGPYLLNQLGSLLYYYTLSNTDLSYAVPICNSLALVFSILTSYGLGERVDSPVRTMLGAMLVVSGIGICMSSTAVHSNDGNV